MTTIALFIQNSAQRITLKTILETDGHKVTAKLGDATVQFSDIQSWRNLDLTAMPTILIASVSEIPQAVEAMAAGVWGYIAVPFQPHEAVLAVERASKRSRSTSARPTLENLRTMEDIEFEHIALALRLCNGNKAKAARALKIGRNTLWRKMKKMEQQKKK